MHILRTVWALCTILPFTMAAFQVLQTGLLANESSVFLSDGCTAALESSISCDQWLQDNANEDGYSYLNDTALNKLCPPACEPSIKSYRSKVVSACKNDPQPFDGLPAEYFIDVIWASYNLTCLKDPKSGDYCNGFITRNLTSSDGTDTGISDLPKATVCAPCAIAYMRLLQSTSFSNYDEGAKDEWKSIQNICGVSYPSDVQSPTTNVTTPIGFAPANYSIQDPTNCLSGNTYAVASGDDCGKISTAKDVSTGSLIVLNQLFPDCTNLLGGQSLCLPQSCQIYNVQSGDTCLGIAANSNITYTQLLAWNPSIDGFCSNLISGQNICVSQPGAAWTGTPIAGATATKTGTYATATVAPPGPTAHGTTTHCGKYYEVISGDDCHLITLSQMIALSLFQSVNPAVNKECTNLVPGLYYCVEPTADWNDTDSSSSTITSSFVTPPDPTPTGTTPQCYTYHTIVSGDYCGLLESSYGITFAQLQLWNPSLNAACSNLLLGQSYCVSSPESPSPDTGTFTTSATQPANTAPPGPTQSGVAANCKLWTVVQAGGSCAAIEAKYGISFAQFLDWNPAVGGNCENLWVGEAYCVGVDGGTRRRDLEQHKRGLMHFLNHHHKLI